MSSIDNRIVNMQFNNKGFESGVSSTMSALQKLENALKFKNGTKGIEEVDKGIKSLSSSGLSGLSAGVEAVTAKFSALGVIAATALSNITNRAMNAGIALAKSLSTDQIMAGFSEYELKMNSIQTILSNTAHAGTTLDQVTSALNELNTYADKTIYNFGEMTRNVGTFTAAGVDLDTSVMAIKGIANLAAASGSSSAQASSAMYQLSQAIAAGKVNLMDWNSVVNAGMGGKLFQDALKETAKSMGKNIDASKSFRDSLQDGWLTSDILLKTLEQFSLDEDMIKAATEIKTVTGLLDTMKESVQSGWAQSWEHIIGDKEQATKTLTAISDAFNKLIEPSTNARNEMLKFWNENKGRDAVIKGLSNVFGSLGKGLGAVSEAFRDVFPPMTGEKLVDISNKFKDFTEKIKMNDEVAGKIKDTFKGVFSAFDLGGKAVAGLFKGLTGTGSIFKTLGGWVLDATSSIGKFVTKINDAAERSKIFDKVGEGIRKGFNGIGKVLDGFGDAVKNAFSKVGDMDFSFITNAFSKVGDAIGKAFDWIGDKLSNFEIADFFDLIGKFATSGALVTLAKGFKLVYDKIKDFFDKLEEAGEGGGLLDNIKEVLDGVKSSLESWQSSLNASTLLKIAAAIGLLAVSLKLLEGIDAGDMTKGLGGIGTLIAELMLGMYALAKIGDKFDGSKGLVKGASSMILMAAAILVLSVALKSIAELEWDDLAKGLIGVAGCMAILAAATRLIKPGELMGTAASLVVVGAAVKVLASAVKDLSTLSPQDLTEGVVAVGALMAEMVAFTKLTKGADLLATSASMVVLAAGLKLLASAVEDLGKMTDIDMLKGIGGIGVMLAELAMFANATSGLDVAVTAVGLAVLSASLLLMADAVEQLGSLSWGEIGRGLTALAGGLVLIGAAAWLIPGSFLATTGLGLAVMSASLLVLSAALHSLGDLSWEEIGRSLTALAGSLVILTAAMIGMTLGIAGALAMQVMASALAIFTPQLILLSQLSMEEIKTGLIALAGSFAVLGAAGLLLAPVSPILLLLGVAIAALGVGTLAAGIGVTALATGLTALATSGAIGIPVLIELFTQLINLLPQLGIKMAESIASFTTRMAELIPQIATSFMGIITGILTAIAEAAPQISEAMLTLLQVMCDTIVQAAPMMVSAGMELLLALMRGIRDNIGEIVTVASDIVVNFLNALQSEIPRITQAGIDFAISLINALADGIESNQGSVTAAIENLLSACLYALGASINDFFTSGGDLMESFINGLLGKEPDANSAGTEVAGSTKEGLDSEDATDAGDNLVQTFIDAITGKSGDADSAGAEVAGSAKEGMDGEDASSAGSNLVQGFINGMGSLKAKAISKGIEIAKAAADAVKNALKINSPSKVLYEIGRFTAEGFALGIGKNTRMVDNPSKSIANRAVEGMSAAISAASDILSNNVDASPTITPVMDLTNVETGARTISSLMNNPSINASMSGLMSRSIGQIQNRTGNEEVVSALKDLKKDINKMNNTTYQINGITYDDGSNINSAVETLVRAARIERRI